MDKARFSFELKEFDGEAGTFTGLASVFGNEDWMGDIVERGAFQRTISQNPEVPILWQHDSWAPIGKGRVSEVYEGLLVEGKLALGVQQGREAYELLKEEALRGLSIGYDTLDFNMVDEVRHLTEVRLWEVSLVTFAANPKATVLSVKDKGDPEGSLSLPVKLQRRLKQLVSECVLQGLELEHDLKGGKVLTRKDQGLVAAASAALTKLSAAPEGEGGGEVLTPEEAPAGDTAPLQWTEELAQKWMEDALGTPEGVTVEFTAGDSGVSCSVANANDVPGDKSFTKGFQESSGGTWWETHTGSGTGDFPQTSPAIYIPDEKDGWSFPLLPTEPPYIIEFPFLTGDVPTITEEEPVEGKELAPAEVLEEEEEEITEDDPFAGAILNEDEAAALDEFGKSLASMTPAEGEGKDPPAEGSGPTSDDPLLQEMSDFARSLSQQREDE